MPQRTSFAMVLCLGPLLAAGCGGSAAVAMDLAPPPPSSALLADSNRDGVVDERDRLGSRGVWSAAAGALFLANIDDDDTKGAADASDDVVNGEEDEKDLARLRVAAWPAAPMTAVGTLVLTGEHAADAVRFFKRGTDGFAELALPAQLTAAELVAGVELAIEAKDFPQKIGDEHWDGQVVVRLEVTDPSAPAGGGPLVTDAVALRVAPYVMVHNLSSIYQVWNAASGDTGGMAFRNDLVTLTESTMSHIEDANPSTPDQWAEDWWQIGITFFPAVGGAHGMRVGQRSAQPPRGAGAFAETQLAPDFGVIWPHTESDEGQADNKGYSLDSFGNHDTVPPYTTADARYPLGRILVGSGKWSKIDPVVRAFYEAQRAQPMIQIDSTWLLVGHVDEIVSFVPSDTERGWKVLIASPRLARAQLQQLVAEGQGDVQMFTGKQWITADLMHFVPAVTTVRELLADVEVMAASEAAQGRIDAQLVILKRELVLTDDEIIEMPFLFQRIRTEQPGSIGGYELVAHMPGTVNLRASNGGVGVPTPHGPRIRGTDYFEADILSRLGSAENRLGADGKGLSVTFVEDWDNYHIFDGEVHCGTTTSVIEMPGVAWWEAQ